MEITEYSNIKDLPTNKISLNFQTMITTYDTPIWKMGHIS